MRHFALVFGFLLLVGCGEEQAAEAPPAQEPTREATGHYCGMIVVDHPGPKGHIFVGGRDEPVWFSSVRDTVAFTMLPEETKDLRAVWVNDMGQVKNWKSPEAGTWIDARAAWFVVGSRKMGGMGAPEPVPFGKEHAAHAFAGTHGGHVVAFADIPRDYVLGDVPDATDVHAGHQMGGNEAAHQGHSMSHSKDPAQ